MKRFILAVLSLCFATLAQSAALPSDWAKWPSVHTPLTAIGALPDCSADVSKLPPIYQETVKTYCSVRPGGPGKVAILVRPEAMKAFSARDGKLPDGADMILHLKDMKALFVTSYVNGKPTYNVFTEDGKDATAASGPLAAATCNTCHTGYQSFCKNGQCGSKK
jgi:hypothetical protein